MDEIDDTELRALLTQIRASNIQVNSAIEHYLASPNSSRFELLLDMRAGISGVPAHVTKQRITHRLVAIWAKALSIIAEHIKATYLQPMGAGYTQTPIQPASAPTVTHEAADMAQNTGSVTITVNGTDTFTLSSAQEAHSEAIDAI